MLIAYSDAIIYENQHPQLVFSLPNFKGEQTLLEIYQKKQLLDNFSINNQIINVPLPDNIKLDQDLTEIELVVSNKTEKQFFTYSVLKLSENEPYIICDIDFTISATNFILYLSNNILSIKSLKYSADTLNDLSHHYKIIYLTGRLDLHSRVTKIWLSNHGFPKGPIIARSRQDLRGLAKFKINALEKIIPVSAQGIGIGDLRSDITAYRYHGLLPIHIRRLPYFYKSNDHYKFKNGYYRVKTWKGIQKLFNEKLLNQ